MSKRALLNGVFLALTLSAAAPAPAWADVSESEVAAARELFMRARELEREARWAEALEKLEAVGRVRMTPQVRFHIALCLEHTGKLVAARNAFEEARRDGAKQGADQVVLEAEEHIAALAARTPQLRLELPADVEGVEVRIDGHLVGLGMLAVPLPLDPGPHRVQATAPGHEPFEQEIVLEERTPLAVTVSFTPAKTAPLPPPVAPKLAPVPPPPRPERPEPAPDRSRSTAGWIVLGGGTVLLAGAGVSALVRRGAISDIDDQCPSHQDCDASLRDSRDRAQTFGVLSGVLGVLGVAAVGTGGVLLWTSSEGDQQTVKMRVNPTVAADQARIVGVVQW